MSMIGVILVLCILVINNIRQAFLISKLKVDVEAWKDNYLYAEKEFKRLSYENQHLKIELKKHEKV